MMRGSQAKETLVLEIFGGSKDRAGSFVFQKAPERQKTPPASARVMQVGQSVARAGCNIIFVPHHGQGASAKPDKWLTKLQEIAELQDGWDSYEAPKPSHHAIAAARLYLSTLKQLGWEPTRVAPSAMGGVGITHRQDSRKVYVEFYNNGTVHALFSDRTLKMETRPVEANIAAYYRFICQAREYLNG